MTAAATIAWQRGEPWVREAVERWLAADAALTVELLRGDARRRVARIAPAHGDPLVVKHFLPPQGSTRWREALKSALGQAPATREWDALRALRRARVPCPRPLARATLPRGGELVVTAAIPGPALVDALAEATPDTELRLASALARLIRALHDAGFVHRDLHVGNVVVGPQGPVLLDLQRVQRSRARAARVADWGALDFSLGWAGVGDAARARLREGAPEDAASVARAARRHAQRHYRRRARHCLRPSESLPRIALGGARGLRVAALAPKAVEAALAAHAALAEGPPVTATIGRAVSLDTPAVLKRDHRALVTAVKAGDRTVVVKEVRKGGWRRRLADVFRGSPARRGWVGGHGLAARGIGAAAPLAMLESRRLGLPVHSLLVCEDLRHAIPVSELSRDATLAARIGAPRLLAALVDLVVSLHRTQVLQGDLQAQHVYLEDGPDRLRTRLIDLDGVRLRRRLSEAERIENLAVLNASLADAVASPALRRDALRRYLGALPCAADEGAVCARVAARSRAQGGLWRGEECGVSSARR